MNQSSVPGPRSGRILGLLVGAALLAALCATSCQAPRPEPQRTAQQAAEPAADPLGVRPPAALGPALGPATGATRPLRVPATVDVLLHSGQRGVPLELSGTSQGSVTLERVGEHLHNGRGDDLGEGVWLSPGPRSAGLELDDRIYAGRLLVRVARKGRGLEVLNRVDLEDYVAGVLAAELSMWSAQPAELEAQAVACRSFAVHALATPRPYLFADVRDQVYRGRPPEQSASRVRLAVTRTRGEVLVEAGRVVDARYHAACGGDTARGGVVFPALRFRCLTSVECAPCRGHEGPVEAALGSGDTWRITLSPADLELLALELGIGDRVIAFEPAAIDAAGRWLAVRFDGPRGSASLSFEELRGQLGTTRLKSARVVRTWPRPGTPIARDGGLFIEGRGRGHGVGLCQTGARGYARRGWSAERILDHYYPGAQVRRSEP